MRRLLAIVLLAATVASCGNRDRYELHYGSAITLAQATGVQALAVEGDVVYYGVFDTGDVFRIDGSAPVKIGHVDVRAKGANGLQSIAVRKGRVFVSYVRADRHLVVGPLDGPLTWVGPLVNSLRREGHIGFDPKGNLYVSVGGRIYELGGRVTKVSDGWVNPFAFAIDPRNRMFVADQPTRAGGALVARGRENDRPKRRRFASTVAGSKPSGVAFVRDELLVCRSNVGDVMRMHIGIEDVARQRDPVEGVKCRNAIAAMEDGSVVTALSHEIRRYPPA